MVPEISALSGKVSLILVHWTSLGLQREKEERERREGGRARKRRESKRERRGSGKCKRIR